MSNKKLTHALGTPPTTSKKNPTMQLPPTPRESRGSHPPLKYPPLSSPIQKSSHPFNYNHLRGEEEEEVEKKKKRKKFLLFITSFYQFELSWMAGSGVFAEILEGDVFKYYSDGEWRKSSSGKFVPIINPTTRKTQYKVQGTHSKFSTNSRKRNFFLKNNLFSFFCRGKVNRNNQRNLGGSMIRGTVKVLVIAGPTSIGPNMIGRTIRLLLVTSSTVRCVSRKDLSFP